MLLALVAIFALPLLVVLAMYQFEWRPGGASHGELVVPPRPLQLPVLHDLQGKEFRAGQWKNKWNLVYIDAAGCAAPCLAQMHLLRQVHASLSKEIDRVQRVLLIPANATGESLNALQQKYPDLVILVGGDVARPASQFDLPGQPAGSAGRVYLVDPLGNLMMSYPSEDDPKGLRKDLLRLLQYSWTG